MADNEEHHIGIVVEPLAVKAVRIASPVSVEVNYGIRTLCVDIVEPVCICIAVLFCNYWIRIVIVVIDKPSVLLRIGAGTDNGCVFYRSETPGQSLR